MSDKYDSMNPVQLLEEVRRLCSREELLEARYIMAGLGYSRLRISANAGMVARCLRVAKNRGETESGEKLAPVRNTDGGT